MKKANIAKILLVEIIAIVILLIVVFRVSADDRYYEDPGRLNAFNYGVEESTDTGFLSFSFQNVYNTNKTVTTKGQFTFPIDIRIVNITIDYVITDSEDKVILVVPIISEPRNSNVYDFSVTYPYEGDYEKCIFEVFFIGEEIENEEPEKLNV